MKGFWTGKHQHICITETSDVRAASLSHRATQGSNAARRKRHLENRAVLHRAQGPLLPIRAHVKGHSAVKEEAVVSDSEQLPGLWLDHGVFCSSTLTSVLLFRSSTPATGALSRKHDVGTSLIYSPLCLYHTGQSPGGLQR